MFRLGNRSIKNLYGVNPILSYLVFKTIHRTTYDFTVFEGCRTLKRQYSLVSQGRSWTMNSKHLTGNAVDLVPYINNKIVWDGEEAKKAFEDIYKIMNEEAAKIGVTLRCGADWKSVDRPHFELNGLEQRGYRYEKKK